MLNTISGFLTTGIRIFAASAIDHIDLFHSPDQAVLYLDGDRRVLLDETETEIVRQWAELELETATKDTEESLIRRRCDVIEMKQRAQKLNRRTAPRPRKPALSIVLGRASANGAE